ncbi:hypothetical protein ACR9MG_02605 [Helicobacter pylori]
MLAGIALVLVVRLLRGYFLTNNAQETTAKIKLFSFCHEAPKH